MEAATEFHLKAIPWSFFGTLTWGEHSLGSVTSRETQAWELFRDWAKWLGVKLYDLPIALRWERGEAGDRPHAHFLLWQSERINVSTCFFWMHHWNKVKSLGFAKIRQYNPNIDTGVYVTKGLETASGSASNANTYEVGKFDRADRLQINDAAWRRICSVAGVDNFPQHRAS